MYASLKWVIFELLKKEYLVLIVPNFDHAVVGTRDEIGLVTASVVVDAVDALLVAFKSEIWLI